MAARARIGMVVENRRSCRFRIALSLGNALRVSHCRAMLGWIELEPTSQHDVWFTSAIASVLAIGVFVSNALR